MPAVWRNFRAGYSAASTWNARTPARATPAAANPSGRRARGTRATTAITSAAASATSSATVATCGVENGRRSVSSPTTTRWKKRDDGARKKSIGPSPGQRYEVATRRAQSSPLSSTAHTGGGRRKIASVPASANGGTSTAK